MKLLELYEQVVDYCGLVVENDRVYIKAENNNKEPYLINGKQLVIPSDKMLRGIDSSSMVVMHPLSEDILRGESALISKLRYTIGIRINVAIGILTQALLNLVASPENHKSLTPEQTELLYSISDIDDKTVQLFTSFMLKEINDKEDRLFTYTYLKKGGVIEGVKYPRAGITIFPFYQSLIKGEKYKFRVKDISAYKAIFKFMFPDIDSSEEYNYGSKSEVAPFFDALMFTSYKLTQRIDELFETYQDYIDEVESLRFNHDWIDLLRNPSSLKNEIRLIPGSTVIVSETPEPVQPQAAPQWQPQALPGAPQGYNPAQPHMYNQPPVDPRTVELKETGHGIDFNSLKAKMGMPQIPNAFARQQHPGYPGQPMHQQRPAPYAGDLLNRQQVPQGMPQPYPPGHPGFVPPGQPMYPQQGYPQPYPPGHPGFVPPGQPIYPQPGYQDPNYQGYPPPPPGWYGNR